MDVFTKTEIAELFALLMKGYSIGMPVSRPMPVISHGSHELRIRSKAGIYRIFYYVKFENAILVFHFFKKTTQSMPKHEVDTARSRLKEML